MNIYVLFVCVLDSGVNEEFIFCELKTAIPDSSVITPDKDFSAL